LMEGARVKSELAIISIGSNLGDSSGILRRAMDWLQTFSDRLLLKSSVWLTTPVACPPGSPLFFNAVAGLWTRADETPETLLARLQQLEAQFGRRPKQVLNEPRPLDLDLVAFGAEIRATPQLTLPHPRAHLRRFVLEPLNEIAPGCVLPLQTKPVRELLSELPADETVAKLP